MRLLVVEDDPDLNRQLGIALGRAGYVVESATDGEQGHYMADTSDFHAVILDIGLPVINGIEVLRKWRVAKKAMPVLILTAADLCSDKVAAIDAGADDYLTKPFMIAELLARVRSLIRRSNGIAHACSRAARSSLIRVRELSRAPASQSSLPGLSRGCCAS